MPGTGEALVAGMWKMAVAAATTNTAIRADQMALPLALHNDCEVRDMLACVGKREQEKICKKLKILVGDAECLTGNGITGRICNTAHHIKMLAQFALMIIMQPIHLT